MYGEIIFPIDRGVIKDWNAMTAMWAHIMSERLGISDFRDFPLILTEPSGNPSKQRKRVLLVC